MSPEEFGTGPELTAPTSSRDVIHSERPRDATSETGLLSHLVRRQKTFDDRGTG